MPEVTAVLRLEAYPNREAAKVGAEQKTMANFERAIERVKAYLVEITKSAKAELEQVTRYRDESKVRLVERKKALAARG